MTPVSCTESATRLHGRVADRRTLDARTREAMFTLLGAHFVGVNRATFERDLEDKSCVILLEDDTRQLRGFSTMVAYRQLRRWGTGIRGVFRRHDCRTRMVGESRAGENVGAGRPTARPGPVA